MDAFGGVAVPWHLTTRELVADVHRVLRPDGIYAVNIIDFGPQKFLKAEIRTVAEEFENVAVISTAEALAGKAGGNFVLVASDQALPVDELRTRLANRADVLDGAGAVRRFVGDAPLLTDDFAPVDQLLTPFTS
jgi:spermidine synthase